MILKYFIYEKAKRNCLYKLTVVFCQMKKISLILQQEKCFGLEPCLNGNISPYKELFILDDKLLSRLSCCYERISK